MSSPTPEAKNFQATLLKDEEKQKQETSTELNAFANEIDQQRPTRRRPSLLESSQNEYAGDVIMLPVDDSPHSEFVFNYVVKNILKDGDSLAILHVYPTTASQVPAFTYINAAQYKELETKLKNRAQEVLNKYAELAKAKNLRYKLQAFAGDPRDVICDAAELFHPRVVCMGSRGHGALKRMLLGSVSDYCVRNCKRPVLICKDDSDESKSGVWKESQNASKVIGFSK